eukprot:scaffold47310_cov66-Phaeocystis_antarctica.AAC.5
MPSVLPSWPYAQSSARLTTEGWITNPGLRWGFAASRDPSSPFRRKPGRGSFAELWVQPVKHDPR